MHNPQQWFAAFVGMTVLSIFPPMPFTAAQTTTQATSWRTIFDTVFNPKEPRDPGPGRVGGPRPAELCQIAPKQGAKLWNLNPVFVWRGNISAIGLRRATDETVLWRQTASSQPRTSIKQVRYTGPSLQPGQSYEWMFFFEETSKQPMLTVPFQVMDESDRSSMTADLAKLEAQLKAKKASEETVALQRANYFAQHQLWADVLQEIYSVKTPSTDLQQIAGEISVKVCQSSRK